MIAGRYHLEREVGRGGMGAVWLAQDRVLGRSVALKRIGAGPGVHDDAQARRAQREARLAATLNHPHVVSVLDLVTEGDQQWLVMEFVEGVTLAELVRLEGPLTPDRAAELLRQAADALAAAHGAGIVHRDVKPSNMMVDARGHVKLTDFGIARATGDESLTQTGMVVGSPAYLAPEVVSGRPATAASDVWSLGASFYFALTGEPAYEAGGNLMATLYRIVSEEPPRPAGSGWLAPLLEGTMAVDPDDRWPMSRVRAFLHAGSGASDRTAAWPPALPVEGAAHPDRTQVLPAAPRAPQATPRRAGRPSALALVGIAVVVVALVAGLWWALRDRPNDTAPPSGAASPSTTPAAPSKTTTATTEAEMAQFVTTYVDTATTDQVAAWRMLTPEFQAQSGNFGDYRRAWRSRPAAQVSQIVADPADLTVSYDVVYFDANGSRLFDDRVSLTLVLQDGNLLIAGEN